MKAMKVLAAPFPRVETERADRGAATPPAPRRRPGPGRRPPPLPVYLRSYTTEHVLPRRKDKTCKGREKGSRESRILVRARSRRRVLRHSHQRALRAPPDPSTYEIQ